MAGQKHKDPNKKEGFLTFVGAVLLISFVLTTFIWFLASHKIVYYSAPVLRWAGVPWAFWAPETWSRINEAFVFYRQHPADVGLLNFVAFANDTLRPLSSILCIVLAALVVKRLFPSAGGQAMRRELSPMQLANEISKVFPAIVPVLHLGADLVADRLPLWRRQTFPEDVWQSERVGGKPLSDGKRLFLDRVEAYFRGGEFAGGPHQMRNGRRWSRMLGFLVVDLLADSHRHEGICFPDRFSSQGKVLFALLAAHAFGGREGKNDYQKAADALNRSCAGAKNGLPNLKVAQWLYDKYRNHVEARRMFQVHHWEHTYLYTLFGKAKLTGKVTHTEFLWLKPLDRILFYSLNTVGRATPHTEAAAVFAQVDFEIKCARSNRLPVVMRSDGVYEAVIVSITAMEGFQEAFDRYLAGTGDDDEWWKELRTWGSAKVIADKADALAASIRSMQQEQVTQAAVLQQVGPPVETAFDTQAQAERQQAEQASMQSQLTSLVGARASD